VLSALVLASSLASGLGCATWNPFAFGEADPVEAELERLEAEQRRMARQERLSEDAAKRAREEVPKTVEGRLERGDAALRDGDLATALWEYAAAHRIDPKSPEPRVRIGYVHLRVNPERAQPLFESALSIAPDHVAAQIGLGLSLLSSNQREEGLSHLERAVEIAPDSPNARASLGVSLDQLGQHDEALVQLEKARELRPRDSRILNNLGVAYLRAGEPARAEPLLRAALREDRRDVSLRQNNLGMALAMQGRFEEAREAFLRAGDAQSAHSNLGYAHYLRGEYAKAVQEYEKALVAGGEASVQVVRNLTAARRALESGVGARPAPDSSQVAGEAPTAAPGVDPGERSANDDPWTEGPPSPAAAAGE
jgi:Flp pilus assembly protein TadD